MRNRTPNSSHRWYDELQSENTQALLDRLEVETEKEEIDTDLIEAILDILDERAPAPYPDETPEESLQKFRETFGPMLDIDEEEDNPRPVRRHHILRNVLAACFCCVMLLMVVQACGIDLIGHFLEWGEETFVLHGRSGGQMVLEYAPDGEYVSTEEAAAACGITDPVVMKWIPRSFGIESVRVRSMLHVDDITTRYVADGDKKIIQKIFVYHGEGGDDTTGEHSDQNATPYVVNDITFLLSSNNGQYQASWTAGNCTCSIVGDLTEDEITQMIDSIFLEEG